MRKFIFYIVAIVFIILLSLPQFWTMVNDILPKAVEGSAQMNIKSLFGEYTVIVNEDILGEVGDKQSRLFTKIKTGENTIKLFRKSNEKDFYYVFSKTINFLPNTQVDIEWESGPTLESSNGVVRYFSEIPSSNGTELFIIAFPADSTVSINDVEKSDKRMLITETNPLKVNVKNIESYEPKEIQVEFNSVRNNLRHTVEVYLYKKPFIQEAI